MNQKKRKVEEFNNVPKRVLKGAWRDFRECHIETDWLLTYALADFELRPTRLGTHAELFE